MRTLLVLPVVLLAACITAQKPPSGFDPAGLIATHYGGKPTGTPASLTWKPQGEDAKQVGYLLHGTVGTTVDTILYPKDDEALVFFRTAKTKDDDEFSALCWLCEDWISVAVYTRMSSGWSLVRFDKWFTKQGVYQMAHKPELVETGRKGRAVRVISSDGEPEQSSTTHRFFGVPGLLMALSIITDGVEVERGGPHGPMEELVFREYRFIPSDKDWYDVEVLTRHTEGGDGKPSYLAYSESTGKYVDPAPPAKAPVKR